MIGGTDIILVSPSGICVSDLILRTCREHWRDCVFQDAESDQIRPLDDPWVWKSGTLSTEFFVYRDVASAAQWAKEGAGPATANTMLHFLLKESSGRDRSRTEVTVVVDSIEGQVGSMIESLRSAFLCALAEAEPRMAA